MRLRILHFLLCFLRDFASHAVSTLMHLNNLSMVFAPTVIRPPVENLDSAMQNIHSIAFVEFLLRYHESIWAEVIVPRSKSRSHRASCYITRNSSRKNRKAPAPGDIKAFQSTKAQSKMHLELPAEKGTKPKAKTAKRNSKPSPLSARATSTDPVKLRSRRDLKRKRVASARFPSPPGTD